MRSLESWFAEYSENHQNPTNQIIHKICVPLIFFSIVGMLLLIPYKIGPLKIGEVLVLLALGWYATLGIKAFAIMLLQVMISYMLVYAIYQVTEPLIPLIAIFVWRGLGSFLVTRLKGKSLHFSKTYSSY